MMKKIFSVLVAFALSLSLVCMPVSASSSDDVSDVKSACGQYFSLLDDYLKGDITYEAFKDKTTALLHNVPDKGKDTFTQLVNGLTNAAEGISYGASNGTAAFVQGFRDFADGMADFYDEFYDGVIDPISNIFDSLWDKFCNDNGYVSSNVDMMGYSSVAVRKFADSKGVRFLSVYYGDNGTLKNRRETSNGLTFDFSLCIYKTVYYNSNGTVKSTNYGNGDLVSSVIIFRDNPSGDYWELYGDWRYDDGTSADDLTTPNEENPFSPDDIPNEDLSKFLEALLDKLKNMFPDLSTIEGLLQAIYNRLGTLDSDNDNALLSNILTAIQALKADTDNTEFDPEEKEKIINELTDIADNMISSEDFKVDSDLHRQRFEVIKMAVESKFSFVKDIKKLIDYIFSCYTGSSLQPRIPVNLFGSTHYIDFSAFDDNIDLIRFVIAAFVYITYAIHTYRKIPSYINGGDNE